MDFACCCRSAISFCFCWTASLISLTCAIFASTSVRETSSVCLLKVFAEVFRTFNKASKPFKIASFDSAEDQHNFPDGPFRPLPEILQTLNYGGTWCGCHGVSLTQNRFKFLTLFLNLRAPPVQRSRKIVLGFLQFCARDLGLRLDGLRLLLQIGDFLLFLLDRLVDIADLRNFRVNFSS